MAWAEDFAPAMNEADQRTSFIQISERDSIQWIGVHYLDFSNADINREAQHLQRLHSLLSHQAHRGHYMIVIFFLLIVQFVAYLDLVTAVDETWTSDLVAMPPSMPIRATENDYGYSEPSVAHEYYIGSCTSRHSLSCDCSQ